jgi:hypothetical protein
MTPSNGWEALHNLKQPMRVPVAEGRLASVDLSKHNDTLKRAGQRIKSNTDVANP